MCATVTSALRRRAPCDSQMTQEWPRLASGQVGQSVGSGKALRIACESPRGPTVDFVGDAYSLGLRPSRRLRNPSGREGLVHVSPLASYGPRDLRGSQPFLPQGDNLGVIEGNRPALVDALRFGLLDACLLPVPDEPHL